MTENPPKFEVVRKTVDDFDNRQIVSTVISPEDSALMTEPKRSCKTCYGRGYVLYLEGDGYTNVAASADSRARIPNMKRISKPCYCVFRKARFLTK